MNLGEDLGSYGSGLAHLFEGLRRLALVSPEEVDDQLEPLASVIEPGSVKDEGFISDDYAIVLTTAPPGSIPAKVWRASHVIYV